MNKEKIFNYSFKEIYHAYLNKASRKDKTKKEVHMIITWLTGYSEIQIEEAANSTVSLGDFINNSPDFNKNAYLIKGTICNVKIENIQDEFIKKVRYLDKLIDELTKGKKMESILRK